MVATISILIPVFAFITFGVVLFLVMISKPYSQAQVAFRPYLVAMLLWSFSAFVVLVGHGDSLFWFKFMTAAATASAAGFFYFVQIITSKKLSWAKWLYLLGFICFVLTMLDNVVVKSAIVSEGAVTYEWGPLFPLVIVQVYGVYIFCMVELVGTVKKNKDEQQRNRLGYLIFGLVDSLVLSLFNFTPLGRYPIDVASNVILAVLIAYAILRHQLLDIKLVIRKGLVYSLPTTIIGTIYFLIISLALNIYHTYSGMQIFLLSLAVAILTALITQPFYQKAQSWVDKLFFRDKYDANLMLQRFSHTAASVLDLERLTSMFLNEIASNFHINRAALFIKHKDGSENLENGGEYHLTAQLGLNLNQDMVMRYHHPITAWLSKQDRALTRETMDITPTFKALWNNELEDLTKINAEIFIPIKAQNDLIGILALGPKLSELSYSNDDQIMLTMLANQTAVAIENAVHFDAEQSRREELDALYSLTRQLLDSDNINKIMDSLVHSAVNKIPVSFASFLTKDESGNFTNRSHCNLHIPYEVLEDNQLESAAAQTCYNEVVSQRSLVLLTQEDLQSGNYTCIHPLIHVFQSVCISPLMLGDSCIGVLVLGEVRNQVRETFSADKLRLINAICDQAASAINRAQLHDQLEQNFIETMVALANAMDARDTYTRGHSERLASLAMLVLRHFTNDEQLIQAMNWAAMLHDIGKIGVPDTILKKPGPLTEEEWEVMRNHPEIGAKIIEPVKRLSLVTPIVRSHHERYDGGGYLRGMQGEKIPLGARVLAVVDAYGAMIDDRVYRKARSHAEAIEELKRCSGTQFDPKVVDAFLKVAEHLLIRADYRV